MSVKTLAKAGVNGAHPARVWLLSQPIPIPFAGTFAGYTVTMDLAAVMDIDVMRLTRDLQQRDRILQRQVDTLWNTFRAAWDQPVSDAPDAPRKRDADPEGHDAASWETYEQGDVLKQERNNIQRAMALRILGQIVYQVDGPQGVEVADPTQAAAWEGWPNALLGWLSTQALDLAKAQLQGESLNRK